MVDNKSYRYPGVQPFRKEDSDIFFGRDDDKDRLHKLIMLEKLVVLFGKSGYGKSSIINAGIIPMLANKNITDRFNYLPVEVRIGKVSGQSKSPVEKVILKINEQLADLEEWSFLDNYENVPSLWYHFKKKQSNHNKRLLLIFDQFEEFFTYSNAEQELFRWELAQLLYTDIPQVIRENLDDVNEKQYTLLSTRLDIKTVFSIRSDRLSLLHSMKDALPNILQSRFELKGLRLNQAKEAIILPALLKDDKFITHPFSYDDASINIILKELSTVHGDGSESIEAFHLQIICQACESKIEEKLKAGIKDTEINREDLPEFRNLYERYYKRQIDKLPGHLKSTAQIVLEEGLIFEDTTTGECRRLSVDGNILRRQFASIGVEENLLNQLENTFLVRREPNTVGGFSYEVAHDTIVEPIIKIKRERKRLEQTEEIKREALKEATIKRRKKGFIIITTLTILLLVGWNWKAIYFRYVTLVNNDTRPIVRLKNKLSEIVIQIGTQNLIESRKIKNDSTVGSWEAAQIIEGLRGKLVDSTIRNFLTLTSKSIADTSCCCWMEVKNQKDFRASGWIVSSIGTMGLREKYKCNIINFFLNNQLSDGSWSMLQIDTNLIQYGSTYATCHVLRALHNLGNIPDLITKNKIDQSIHKGIKWLLASRIDSISPVWNDYPKNSKFESLKSISLSGLAIHTLNLLQANTTGFSMHELNKHWLRNLKSSQASIEINHKEQSDMFYKFGKDNGVADYRDLTRHLIMPWEIIATIDAYKDGSFSEKAHANYWLDIVVDNLNAEDIMNNPAYINAEIFIALRYLQDKNYSFH